MLLNAFEPPQVNHIIKRKYNAKVTFGDKNRKMTSPYISSIIGILETEINPHFMDSLFILYLVIPFFTQFYVR